MNNIKEPPASNFIPLDEEEKELMEATERGDYVPVPDQENSIKRLMEAAKNTTAIMSKKPITIRLRTVDINFFKLKAMKEDIPYQTLISFVIHQYAE